MSKTQLLGPISITRVPGERDPKTIHPLVQKMYLAAGYDGKPQSAKEAEAVGVTTFNALQTSAQSLDFSKDGSVHVTLVPTRYLVGQALRDLAKKVGDDFAAKISPNMFNAGAILYCTRNGAPVIIGRVKMKGVLGAGEVHGAIAGTNVSADALSLDDLLAQTLIAAAAKAGLDCSAVGQSDFCLSVGEAETGQTHFAAVITLDFDTFFENYLKSLKGKEKGKVAGLAIIPVRDAGSIRESVEVFEPDGEDGGQWKSIELPDLRPHAQSLVDALESGLIDEVLLDEKAVKVTTL